eukprot:TRINITY_DN5509_c0_g1_i2.p1 TRINITY_DN5509_c0_g1~~TRINITY_DN5509_c0_g1_i2.p1  ORF type:complete len:120 (+),score=28.20 TRINITY_DN5509_c0_g1_i2:55-360(+)
MAGMYGPTGPLYYPTGYAASVPPMVAHTPSYSFSNVSTLPASPISDPAYPPYYATGLKPIRRSWTQLHFQGFYQWEDSNQRRRAQVAQRTSQRSTRYGLLW